MTCWGRHLRWRRPGVILTVIARPWSGGTGPASFLLAFSSSCCCCCCSPCSLVRGERVTAGGVSVPTAAAAAGQHIPARPRLRGGPSARGWRRGGDDWRQPDEVISGRRMASAADRGGAYRAGRDGGSVIGGRWRFRIRLTLMLPAGPGTGEKQKAWRGGVELGPINDGLRSRQSKGMNGETSSEPAVRMVGCQVRRAVPRRLCAPRCVLSPSVVVLLCPLFVSLKSRETSAAVAEYLSVDDNGYRIPRQRCHAVLT